jgi:hypothetical protein
MQLQKQMQAQLMLQQQQAAAHFESLGGLAGMPAGLGASLGGLPGLPGLPPPGGAPLSPEAWSQAVALAGPAELYCANLPPGLEAPQLTAFLGAAYLAALPKGQTGSAAGAPGHPFTACHLSEDGATAFLEVRSSGEAERCVATLDAILLDDHELKIGALVGSLQRSAAACCCDEAA